MIFGLSLIALFLYISGYLSARGIIQHPDPTVRRAARITFPPKWLYYLCGAPKSNKYPVGTITAVAFRAQIAGIIFGIFTFIVSTQNLNKDEFLIGTGICVFVPYIISLWVTKNYEAH